MEVEEVEWLPATDGNRPIMKSTNTKRSSKPIWCFLPWVSSSPSNQEFAENVFVAGDAAHGASLVVRALADGRVATK